VALCDCALFRSFASRQYSVLPQLDRLSASCKWLSFVLVKHKLGLLDGKEI
jgi:hypothetical protein